MVDHTGLEGARWERVMVEYVTQKALWLRRGSVGGILASSFLWEMRGLQVHLPPSFPPTDSSQTKTSPSPHRHDAMLNDRQSPL